MTAFRFYRERHGIWLALLASVCLSFLIFGNGIKGDFVLDDTIVIVGNPLIEARVPNPVDIFSEPYHFHQPKSGLYRPLTILSYAFNYKLFGQSPASFHVGNILLHALCGFLLFLLVMQLLSLRGAWIAMVLFLVLPIHVEDVTSIVGRAELLSLGFVLLALLSAMRRHYVLGALCFLLALFSKESAIAFLPIWLGWEFFIQKTSWKLLMRPCAWSGGALVLYAWLRYAALGEYVLRNDATAIYNPIKFAPMLSGFWTACKVLALYLQKAFFSTSFSSDYSFNQIPIVTHAYASFAALSGLLLIIACLILIYRGRATLFGWSALFFFSFFFIISNFVFKTGTVMAERLMYAPSAGLIILLACGAEWYLKRYGRNKVVYGLCAGLALVYGYITVVHNRDWLNETNLFTNAYAQAPQSVVNQTNRAYQLVVKDDNAQAAEIMDRVLAVAPDHVPALNLAAQIQKNLGNSKRAEEYWKRAIILRSDFLRAYLGLGALYYEHGFFVPAESVLQKSVDQYPRWSEVLYLSLVKSALGKYDEAIEVIEKNFGTQPVRKDLTFALGVAYYKKGDVERGTALLLRAKNPAVSEAEMLKNVRTNSIFLLNVQ